MNPTNEVNTFLEWGKSAHEFISCALDSQKLSERLLENQRDPSQQKLSSRAKKQFEHFGEYAIVAENGLRRASVASASSSLELFYLQAADYKDFAGASDEQHLSTQRAFLPTVPSFSQMSHEDISELAFRCSVRNFKAGSLIYKQGEEPKHM